MALSEFFSQYFHTFGRCTCTQNLLSWLVCLCSKSRGVPRHCSLNGFLHSRALHGIISLCWARVHPNTFTNLNTTVCFCCPVTLAKFLRNNRVEGWYKCWALALWVQVPFAGELDALGLKCTNHRATHGNRNAFWFCFLLDPRSRAALLDLPSLAELRVCTGSSGALAYFGDWWVTVLQVAPCYL